MARTLTCHPDVDFIFEPLAKHYGLVFATDDKLDVNVQTIRDADMIVTLDWSQVRVL